MNVPAETVSLRRNFSWTLIGNVVYAASQWGMLIVLAKLGSPEIVGQFSLGLAITAPVIIFASLGLRSILITDVAGRYLFGDYLGVRMLAMAASLAVIAGIAATGGYTGGVALVIVGLGLTKAVEAVSEIAYGALQKQERMDKIATSMIVKGLLSLLGLAACMLLGAGLLPGVAALLAIWTIVLLGYDLPVALRALATEEAAPGRPRFEGGVVWRLTLTGLPLAVVTMLVSLNANIPRYFLVHELGERQLGVFSALSYLMISGTMVAGAMGQAASPRLARHFATAEYPQFKRLLLKLSLLSLSAGLAGALVAAVFGEELLRFIYSSDYSAHTELFLILMVAGAITYAASLLGYGITAARLFTIQVPVFAFVTLANLLVSWQLIPRYGLLGAGWSVLLTALVQLVAMTGTTLYCLHRC